MACSFPSYLLAKQLPLAQVYFPFNNKLYTAMNGQHTFNIL